MQIIEANGLHFYLDIRGFGPRVLFIGGSAWDLRNEPNPLNSSLTHDFQVACYDQRGLGQSDKPPGPYVMRDYVNDAVAVMQSLSWNTAHIVGYSFGGMVAQELAIQCPELVERLVIAVSSPGGDAGASYPIETLLDLEPYERARRSLEIADTRFDAEYQKQHAKQAQLNIEKRIQKQQIDPQDTNKRHGLKEQLNARASHDTSQRLHTIKAPTLIVSGRYDGQASLSGQRYMHQHIERSEFYTLEGSHNLIVESNEFYHVTSQFLNKHASQSGNS